MPKPYVVVVDDDANVLGAVRRDLRSHFHDEYRILAANSGAEALDAVRELTGRGEDIALFLVDQRMPKMTGVEFLHEAIPLSPGTKKILLTAYSDTDAAIRAINEVHIDYYLTKPWDPPEEKLYPALDDVLFDWKVQVPEATGAAAAPYNGIRVLGHRWSPQCHSVRDFLARNQVPYQWVDIEGAVDEPGLHSLIAELPADAPCLPIVLFPDGGRLDQPTTVDLAEKIGLQSHASVEFYDLIIIGAGPAGLAAAVYGASEGLKTLMVEREVAGGQAGSSSRIENYLGFPSGIAGGELAHRAVTQAKRFGVEILSPQEVHGMRIDGQYRYVTLADGIEISCNAMLIATGVQYSKLNVPGLEPLVGAGVYYGAAMTEATSCKDDDVYLVGGANSAGQAAIHFSRYARCVTLLVRGDSLEKSMSYYLIEELKALPNVRVLTHTEVAEAHGESSLEAITLRSNETGEASRVPARALFIFIGATPRTECLAGKVARDEKGFILSGPDLMLAGKHPEGWPLDRDPFLLETSVPGIFVAGDVRHGSVKRVASGVGEGSIAVQMIHQYLSKLQ